MERIEKKFPRYYTDHWAKRDPGISVKVEKVREQLKIEVNKAIWEKHPAFLSLLQEFGEVKEEFLKWIQSDSGVSPELKKTWTERVLAIQLIAPNSHPNLMDRQKNVHITLILKIRWSFVRAIWFHKAHITPRLRMRSRIPWAY